MDSLPLDSSLIASNNAATPYTPLPPRQQIVEGLSRASAVSSPPSREEIEEPMARINEMLRQRGLEFELSEEPTRLITRVIDRETGDVIRQIPNEEVLAVFRHIEEMQGGLISLEA
ncbi:flagellar protein FlaG [Halomonas sp. PAMB 3264]|uniref:flagellar protein FlaG n=1 Tax=unclassified Halomonas TaxID=2609666 RepID=UPI00289A21ED|nr:MULTISPECIES: flagellar protein FlaG [unclassified Halomonas]WNL38846.1 flagellar protein FlaG [Halomonas sp. PAMB 3232]WNL42185.1 flagellar protein FlaG [Halomonas sp. PAMB 3264]